MDPREKVMRPRALILTSEPTDAPGGMEHAVRELETGLDRLGYAVAVLNRGNAAPRWVARPRNKWMGYVADAALSWFLGRKVRKLVGPDLIAVVSNGSFGLYLRHNSDKIRPNKLPYFPPQE